METSPKKKTLRAELIRLRRDAEQIEDRAVAEINLLDRAQQGDDKAYRELVDQINRRAETAKLTALRQEETRLTAGLAQCAVQYPE